MKGRKAKSTKTKDLQGTLRKSRASKPNMKINPVEDLPEPPLHWNQYATDEWYRILTGNKKSNLVKEIDLPLLKVYCYNYGQWMEATVKMSENDIVIIQTNKAGEPYETLSAWAKVKKDAETTLMKLASEYGFTPASRGELKPTELEKEQNPFARFGT